MIERMLNEIEHLLNSEDIMHMKDRNGAVDFVRTAALLGICVVNMTFLGLPVEAAFRPPEASGDRFAAFAVEALFQAKFFLLFSFVFGWGMHIQALSAQRAGVSFAGRYGRRLAGLALLGCLHAVLVFTGDILLLYALLGLLIWPLRGLPPWALMRIAAGAVPVAVAAMLVLALLLPEEMPAGLGVGLGGSYFDATYARLADWPATFGFLLLFQGPLAFGAFAAGLAAAKSDFFSAGSPGQAALFRAAPWLIIIGLPLNMVYAAAMSGFIPENLDWLVLAGFVAIAAGAPMLSAAYLAAFLRLSRLSALPAVLVRAGRNSLSAYVAQGVIAGLVFGGYGLGLFGALGQATLAGLGLAVALVAMVAVGLVAGRFGRGPLEAVLRRMTYGAGH